METSPPIAPAPLDAKTARQVLDYIQNLIDAGMSAAKVAVESGVSSARIRAALNGDEAGDILPALLAWKTGNEAAGAIDRGFVLTPTAKKMIAIYDQVREPSLWGTGGERGMALIYGAPGTGKTETAKWYERENNAGSREKNVALLRVDDLAGKNLEGIYRGIIDAVRSNDFYRPLPDNASFPKIISCFMDVGSLIILDEAYLISPQNINHLRALPDKYGIGIAFLSSSEGRAKAARENFVQVTSRAGGTTLVVDVPGEGDVDALLDQWGVRAGRRLRKLLQAIGQQSGGLRLLRTVVETVRKYERASGKAADFDVYLYAAQKTGAWQGKEPQ